MKTVLRVLAAIIVFLTALMVITPRVAKADSEQNLDSILDEQLSNIDLNELDDFLSEMESGLSAREIVEKMIKGEFDFGYDSFLKYALKIIFNNINEFLPDFFLILAITLISSLLRSSRGYVLSEEISKATTFIFVFVILLIILKDINKCFAITKNVLQNLTKLTEIMSPIIITLALSTGGITTANYFKPTTIIASGGFTVLISSVIFPLILLLFVLSSLGALNEDFNFSGFSSTILGIIKLVLGLLVTIFSIYSVVFGIVGRNIDGVSVKITKYLLSSSVPIVGNMVKDGLDVFILGCSVIKNAVGIVGVVGILYVSLSPVLYNLSLLLLLKICSGFCGIFGENGVVKVLNGACMGLKYLNIAIITSSVVVLTAILSITISVGNAL